MRSLSAHHFRRARQALPSARSYREEMNTILGEIGIHQPQPKDAPAGLLLIASDLGLCGDYNSRLSRLAISEAQKYDAKTIYSVGRRARRALIAHSLTPQRTYEAPASLEGVSSVLLGLAQDVLGDYLASKIGSLHVISAGFEGVGHFTPLSVRVLPIDPVTSSREIPSLAVRRVQPPGPGCGPRVPLHHALRDSARRARCGTWHATDGC